MKSISTIDGASARGAPARWGRRFAMLFGVLYVLPLATHAAWWKSREHPASWAVADWSASGILPPPEKVEGAVLHVMAARTGRWKGIFAHHLWVTSKARCEQRYHRHEVVGWGAPVRQDAYAPDARWYSNTPRIVLTLAGEDAEAAIAAIEKAVRVYPYRGRGTYKVWPGPNSNTFMAHLARSAPAIAPALVPTAIGKDYNGPGLFAGRTPSGRGIQISYAGLAGLVIGVTEGIELNLLGAVVGIDVMRPALKLPGWGRIGLSAAPSAATVRSSKKIVTKGC